jgi:hypothetical protein
MVRAGILTSGPLVLVRGIGCIGLDSRSLFDRCGSWVGAGASIRSVIGPGSFMLELGSCTRMFSTSKTDL